MISFNVAESRMLFKI